MAVEDWGALCYVHLLSTVSRRLTPQRAAFSVATLSYV